MSRGPLALVGAGEYLPAMADLEGGLLAGRPPRYVQLATAAAPEGPTVVDRWHRMGREQAGRLGVEAVPVPVATREDAERADLATMIAGAGLVYLSGGNPVYLAATLRDTAVWAAIVDAWEAGSALAGCSAGAMLMDGVIGLGLVPGVQVVPHYDTYGRRFARRSDAPVLGIDELTAVVGGPEEWEVQGRGSAWLDGREHPAGGVLRTPSA